MSSNAPLPDRMIRQTLRDDAQLERLAKAVHRIADQRNELLEALKRVEHTVGLHGKMDANTPLHFFICDAITNVEIGSGSKKMDAFDATKISGTPDEAERLRALTVELVDVLRRIYLAIPDSPLRRDVVAAIAKAED